MTADIPQTHALVSRGLLVIDSRGERYSQANIGERLAVRGLMTDLREGGVPTGGPPPFSPKAKQKFVARLDSLLSKTLRRRLPGTEPCADGAMADPANLPPLLPRAARMDCAANAHDRDVTLRNVATGGMSQWTGHFVG